MNTLSSLLKWIGNQLNPTQVTHSITRNAGATINQDNTKFVKYGKVVNVQIGLKAYATEIAAGGNIFEGTLNTISLRPAASARLSTYLGQRVVVANINSAGNIIIRNTSGSALTLTSDIILVGVYLTN